jgi:hypothetical protein
MQGSSNESFSLRGGTGRRDWVDTSRYTVVQRFFLARLEHLVALRRSPRPGAERWQRRLLNHAIYSTYRDCVALGLVDEARTVLRGEEGAPHSSASACE